MMGDPRKVAVVFGSSVMIAAILYVVVDYILDSQNLTGGLWDLALFILSVIPVAAAIYYIFS